MAAREQLTSNKKKGSGGDSTASFGSNNFNGTIGSWDTAKPALGIVGAVQPNTPIDKSGNPTQSLIPTIKTFPTTSTTNTRGGVIKIGVGDGINARTGRGASAPVATSVPGVQRSGNSFSGTTGSWDSASPIAPKPALSSDASITNPAQIGQRPNLPNSSNSISPKVGDVTSTPFVTTSSNNGVNTWNTPKGSISSSTLGNISPQRLADLNSRIAADTAPGMDEKRAVQAKIVSDRMDRGRELNAYWNKQDTLKEMVGQQQSAANRGYTDDAAKLGAVISDVYKEDAAAQATVNSSQLEAQKLGYNMDKDERQFQYNANKDQKVFEAGQINKERDQGIEITKQRENKAMDLMNLWSNPNSNYSSLDVGTKLSQAISAGADIPKLNNMILGEEGARRVNNAPDNKTRLAILQSMMSPESFQLYIQAMQNQ
jgi:hypothetical protein